jgi:hypothetical protein
VLVIRWYSDATRLSPLATDNAIGGSTAYRYLHEGIDVLAACAPDLASGITAAKAAGHGHLNLDGTAIRTDRCAPGPALRMPLKKPKGGELTEAQQQYNLAVRGVHAIAERANSLLKTTFKALRRVSVCPWRIGAITKAALVLLHLEHGRPLPA